MSDSLEKYEDALKESQKRLELVEHLKDTEQQVAALTEKLGVNIEALVKRLELKKVELISLTDFMEKLNEKADELDSLESDILMLLKKKLEA